MSMSVPASGPCEFLTCNTSQISPSSAFLQQEPFFFQQQRQYYQHQPPPQYFYKSHDEDFVDETQDYNSWTSSTSTSPPLYVSDPWEENATDRNYYFFMRGPIDESTQFFSSPHLTTPYPPNYYAGIPSRAASLLLENLWNVFDQQFMRHSLGWTITLVIAYMLILIVGVIGNCMVILVVVFRPQMRTVTNMFIMNLAVADLFVIVFCVPATLLANVFTPWILGSFMCKGVAYVQGVSVCASAYSLAAISLDRCKAIYRAMERPKGLSKSQALFTICLIWVIALLLTIPWAVIFNVVVSEKDGLSYCLETWNNKNHGKIYFLVANLIFCYSLPLILISVSNVIIWCHISHRKVPQNTASEGTIKRMHRRTRHGVRKMLGIVTLAFLLSWLPLYVLVTRVKFSENISEDESNILDILLPLAQWLGSWNSSINPVLYAFLNSKFRESFKSLLPTWIPFIHKNNAKVIIRNNVGMATVTNGTFNLGGPHSYTTVYTARNSPRSSSNSSNLAYHHQNQHSKKYHNGQNLLPNGFRTDYPPVVVGTTPQVGNGATETISALVGGRHGVKTNSTIMTTTLGTSITVGVTNL